MAAYDLNLLRALDALLTTGSVHGAAQRMHLSDAAMSRTLGRIRDAFGDPILVRAGRSLTPTPRALDLHARLRSLLDEADALIQAGPALDLAALERTFVIRANEGFVNEFGGAVLRQLVEAAPRVLLHFAVKADKDARALREGRVDLDIGVLGDSGPEIRVQAILRDRFIGVVAPSHPLADGSSISAARYASYSHIGVSRLGLAAGPIDTELHRLGLTRRVACVATSFPVALAMLADTGFVASVPERQTTRARRSLFSFKLPVLTDPVVVSMMWHPRAEHDLAHQWLRHVLLSVCAGAQEGPDPRDLFIG